jgi:hypothetical protein
MRTLRLLVLFAFATSVIGAGTAEASVEKLSATMTAEESQPIPGPVGSKGSIVMDADSATGRVCYQVTWEGPGEMTGLDIHRGEKGNTGPVTINLDPNAECVDREPSAVLALNEWPDGYYVEIHTLAYQFKNGAVRGQVAFADGRPSVKPPNRVD